MAELDCVLAARDEHAGLLGELAPGRGVEVLVGFDEPAGQRPLPPVRMAVALDEQHRELPAPDGQQHDVDSDRDPRIPRRVVRSQKRRFVVQFVHASLNRTQYGSATHGRDLRVCGGDDGQRGDAVGEDGRYRLASIVPRSSRTVTVSMSSFGSARPNSLRLNAWPAQSNDQP